MAETYEHPGFLHSLTRATEAKSYALDAVECSSATSPARPMTTRRYAHGGRAIPSGDGTTAGRSWYRLTGPSRTGSGISRRAQTRPGGTA